MSNNKLILFIQILVYFFRDIVFGINLLISPRKKYIMVRGLTTEAKILNNARYLLEALDKDERYRVVYVHSKKFSEFDFLKNTKYVKKNSLKSYYYQANSKFVFHSGTRNVGIKSTKQIDIYLNYGSNYKNNFETYHDHNLKRRACRFDYLVSGGSKDAELMKIEMPATLNNGAEILEFGNPRIDHIKKTSSETIEVLKKDLDIDLETKVILYVPTWREEETISIQDVVEELAEILGDKYTILYKAHTTGYSKNVETNLSLSNYIDVTNSELMFEDLVTISDVIISDYSSALLDAPGAGKVPQAFVYDIDEQLADRGLLFDPREFKIAPLSFTVQELATNIMMMSSYTREMQNNIEKFANFENGNSISKLLKFIEEKY